jgi:hypothetical protein
VQRTAALDCAGVAHSERAGYLELAAAIAERDPRLARDLFQAIGEAITLHVREGAGDEPPEVAERIARLSSFRDALAQRFPEGT